ncbi:MAG: hypothetical protein L6R40_001629 [Gallowayella cf. fulva]|nr:MAG: hypothetical protein L6R40_001629 [Xanthomendoza cf. fulva]
MREYQYTPHLFLLLLLSFPILLLSATIRPPILPVLIPPRIECSAHDPPPTHPTPQACQQFLVRLAIEAHKEPLGAYRWYGRQLDSCPECVKLPAVLNYGQNLCAAYLDVDEEDDKTVSIFGLRDVLRALEGVKKRCWSAEKRDGRGFPDAQRVWAMFTIGVHPEIGGRGNGTVEVGGRRVSFVDLEEGWGGKKVDSG